MAIIEMYRKGEGKGDSGLGSLLQEIIAEIDKQNGKGKSGGQGSGKGNAGGGGNKGQPGVLTPRTVQKALEQHKASSGGNAAAATVTSTNTEAQIKEDVAFAVTGRRICRKKKCGNQTCWEIKNHPGCAPLSKVSGMVAVGSEGGVPPSYGLSRKLKHDGAVDEDGYQQVRGDHVPPPPPPFVRPEPFGEKSSDDDE